MDCRVRGWCSAVLCAVAVSSVLVPVGGAGSQSASVEGGVKLALANGGSPSDVGVAVSLVAADVVDALVVADSPTSLGEGASAVVSSVLPSGVLVVGGAAAVSDAVVAQLGVLSPGVVVERLGGPTRVGTAAVAARRVLGAGGDDVRVALASGWSLADVGVAASLTAAGGADAVLYGGRDSLGDETAQLLEDYRPQRIEVVGGPAALSEQVRAEAVAAAGPQASARRLWGATRVETAARVARTAAGDCVAAAVIANGWSEPDVGAAAALAAAWGNSVVLYAQSPTELGDATRQAVADIAPQGITLVGDTETLAETLRDTLPAGRSAPRAVDAHQAARLALKDPPHNCTNTGGGGGAGGAGGTGTRGGGGTGDTGTVITTPPPPNPVNDDPLGQVTMSLPAGCVLRDLVAGDEMPYSSYVSGCASLHIPGRNAHYYRLVVRQEGAVTLKVRSTTASHLLVRSASGEVIARYDEPGEIQFYRLSLTRTLGAGTYVIEVAAQWSHFRDHGRGHTLSYSGPTIARPEAYRLAGLSITDVNLAHFAPGTTEYSRNVAADVHTVTVTPSAPLEGAKITVMPPDADVSTVGHQVDIAAVGTTEMTVAVSIPMVVDELVVYRVVLKQLAGTAAPLSDDANPVSLRFEGIGIGDFSADKTDYAYSLGFYERLKGTIVTVTATIPDGATWTANRADENEDIAGHQMSIDGTDVILVTVTSQDNANTPVYRFAPETPMTHDASKDICTSCDVAFPYGLWSDGESMMTMSYTQNTLHVFDMETKRQTSTLELALPSYSGRYARAAKGFWSDGETVWVLHREDDNWEPNDNNLLYAYSRETQERVPAMDMEFPDESGSPTALWIDGEKMYQTTFWDVLYVYEFPSTRDIKGVKIKYDPERPEASPIGNTRAMWSDGTTLYMAIRDGWVRAYDAESARRIPGLDFRTNPHPTNTYWPRPEPRGIWSDGRTMWVIDSIRGYPEAYSMPENARLWKLSVSDGGIGQFHNGKFEYDVEVPAGTTSTTITAEAAFGGGSSSIGFSGTDADDQTEGHQITLTPGEDETVTITVTAPNGTDTEAYTVTITHATS